MVWKKHTWQVSLSLRKRKIFAICHDKWQLYPTVLDTNSFGFIYSVLPCFVSTVLPSFWGDVLKKSYLRWTCLVSTIGFLLFAKAPYTAPPWIPSPTPPWNAASTARPRWPLGRPRRSRNRTPTRRPVKRRFRVERCWKKKRSEKNWKVELVELFYCLFLVMLIGLWCLFSREVENHWCWMVSVSVQIPERIKKG